MKRYLIPTEIISRIIVCGGRHFNDYACLESILDDVLADHNLGYTEVEVVSGGCPSGADALGELYAATHNIQCSRFPAEWDRFGKAAGPIRNSQMVNYAGESQKPIVVAFSNSTTRGTNDTIKKANKLGIEIVNIQYTSVESSMSVFGGIQISDGGYDFDFTKDVAGDIIDLTKQHINFTRMNGIIRYFGYKFNSSVESVIRKTFLTWIKTPQGYQNPGVVEMIDRCVEEFAENNTSRYDYIIAVDSQSALTTILAEKLAKTFSSQVVTAKKLSISDLQVDDKAVKDEMLSQGKSQEYIGKMLAFLQNRYIEPQKKSGHFAISKIAPKYRKWIKPMFQIPDSQELINSQRVLVVDETITTGQSINQVVTTLKASGYSGDVDVLTLLSNR